LSAFQLLCEFKKTLPFTTGLLSRKAEEISTLAREGLQLWRGGGYQNSGDIKR
jgi:hypothetical protein